jgi:hypothetical protein
MNAKWTTAAAVMTGTFLIAGVASAQTYTSQTTYSQTYPTQGYAMAGEQPVAPSTNRLAPVKNAVELTVGTGYQQGFGKITNGLQPNLTDVATAGGGIQAGIGYRFAPAVALGFYGSGAEFGRGSNADPTATNYTATAGLQADFHFIPSGSTADPWLSVGTGWRGYWINADRGTTSMNGLQIGKLQAGVDIRVDRNVAIAPVVGADMSMFLTQSLPNTSFHNVPSPTLNTFLFGGLQGRFDIPTQSSGSSQVARR